MLFKELTICTGRISNISSDKFGHDFAKHGGVILRLRIFRRALNADLLKGFTQPSEGATVKRARQIMRCIWQEKFVSEPCE